MGCDIHAFIEIKLHNKWEYYGEIELYRNYAIFAKLAGIRDNGEEPVIPIAYCRGILDDSSEIYKLHVKNWEGDGHSHSWITSEEFMELYNFTKKFNNTYFNSVLLFGQYLVDFFESKRYIPKEVKNFRIVFFFDN